MAKFLPGLFVGAAIGLLIAPKKGAEMRLELSERWKDVRHKLSGTSTSDTYNRSTNNNDTDPITLPVDALETAKPSSSPLSSNGTLPSSLGRTSAEGATSASTITTPLTSTTASNPTTAPNKLSTYNTADSIASVPTTSPVETTEEAAVEKDTTPRKLDTPYQNPGKSSTASRWLNNNNQHRRG